MADPIDTGADSAAAMAGDAAGAGHPLRNAWVRRLLLVALSFLAAGVIIRLIGKIDWPTVWDALSLLAWWQPLVLLAALLVRQTFNALPLAFFIKGLGPFRAIVNDLTAHLTAVVAPPPADIVTRVAMFTSWGIDKSRAIAGSMMNMVAFYIMRFSVPIIGFLLILPVRFEGSYGISALLGGAVAATLAVIVVLGLRSEQFAERVGRRAGRAASRVRKSIEPERWAAATVQFRHDIKGTFGAGFPRSAIALVGLVLADATMLLLALRFVGVSAAELPAIELYAAFLCVYPLTLFPMMGLGIVDAVLLAVIVEVGGLELEAPAVAGLVVWRAFTLGGPVLLGALSLALWRRSQAAQRETASRVETTVE